LETTVTEPAKKQRELTAEQFIGRIRRRAATVAERRAEHLKEAGAAFEKREATYRCNQLAIVREAERPAAVTMAEMLGLEIDAVPAQSPPSATTDAIASDADTSWLNDPPPPAAPRVEIDRDERRAGKGARTNG
jgi:hypothetical protein